MIFFPVSYLEAKNKEELKQALLYLAFYYEKIKEEREIPKIIIYICLKNQKKETLSVSLKNPKSLLDTTKKIIISYLTIKGEDVNLYLRIDFKGWEYVLN